MECSEMRGGPRRLAIGTVEVDGCWWIGPAPRPIVACINPQAARLGATAAGIQHRKRCVGKDFGRSKHVSGKACLQRLQPPAGTTNPVRQGRALNLDPMPREDLALAIEWGVVAIFAHQHMRQQPWARHSLGNGALGCSSLVDRPAGTATVFGTANT